ncbi:calcium-binding protein [Pseudodonghicola sp.]|uniref:calcium-binding protein n=1 Tax=Pseudodonghicola sp. TaxID=1969463 RepID=UPI003A974014
MTITIELNGNGVDFNAELEALFDGFTPYGMPLFLPETGTREQIVHLDTPAAGEEADTRAVVLEGDDFLYTFSNHSVSGTIDTVYLGTLGSAYDSDSGDLVVNDDGLVEIDAAITLSGLSITNEAGLKGEVHEIVAGLMGGGPDGTSVYADPLLDVIWGQGHDVTGTAGGDSYKGTQYDDTVRGLGGKDVLYGMAGNDTLLGGGGADKLFGGAGKDVLKGGAGNDKLFGNGGADRLYGDAGNDRLTGGGGNDKLFGGAGKDVLIGGAGNDRLDGGAGADTLTGGKGADTFVFASAKEAKGDSITDFSSKQGDIIDLSGIDADTSVAGDQAFTLIDDTAFSGAAGELRVWQAGGNTLVAGDVDGDGSADFRITLEGLHDLGASDFLF